MIRKDEQDDHAVIDLKGLTPKEIDRFCTETMGQKPGQGTRVAVWLFRKKVEDIDSMADLNRPFREQLKRHCRISQLAIEQQKHVGGRDREAALSAG